ncbi:MAG: acyl-CoA dehydrogenase family protein [Candidatus Binatia bacterium]
MDFGYSPEQEELRNRLREWLERRRAAGEMPGTRAASLDQQVEDGRRWQRRLYEGGWCGLSWPPRYGGRGAGLVEQIIFQEELARVGSPQLVNLLALSMVGPLIIDHGTEEQKKRYLKPILTAEEIWCQGFSEPGAGSDLAALATRALPDGDDYVVNGQKVWTSYAQYADFCVVLARTDAEVEKHRGITMLFVDLKSAGVEVRPLRQMNGDSEFNEIYFEDVRVPKENVLGAEGDGWKMAIAMLMYERATLTFQRQLQSRVAMDQALAFARDFGCRPTSPESCAVIRDRLAQAYIESEAMRLTSLRHLTRRLRGQPPGPEGSMEKLFWSEMFQRMLEVPMAIAGPYSMLARGDNRAPLEGQWPQLYMYSRGRTIAAGTSEIQRDIIAQRVLGLPREKG